MYSAIQQHSTTIFHSCQLLYVHSHFSVINFIMQHSFISPLQSLIHSPVVHLALAVIVYIHSHSVFHLIILSYYNFITPHSSISPLHLQSMISFIHLDYSLPSKYIVFCICHHHSGFSLIYHISLSPPPPPPPPSTCMVISSSYCYQSLTASSQVTTN